jgi:hypothetical protein
VSAPSAADVSKQNNPLVVHEWGTFTSVTTKEGYGISWRPLRVESDLPSFIYSVDKGESWRNGFQYHTKSARAVHVRMETPVLYFYTQAQTEVKVKVGFPGMITEWYPQAKGGEGGIDWGTLKITPGLRVELPHDAKQNHYYPARETDAAILEVPGKGRAEHEKFLFYRGVGDFGLPVNLKLDGDKVILTNSSKNQLAKAILFENRAGQIGFSVLDLNRPQTTVDRPVPGSQVEKLTQELKGILIAEGLYEKEAEAMLNTWRDSWFEEGLRLFFIIPRADTDRILPLTIEPQPAAVVRVLVGRSEVITPEMEQHMSAQLLKLKDPSPKVQTQARNEINRYGRFIESILGQISDHSADPQVQSAARKLMQEMN